MDNLCHSLVGAALAECGLRRRTRLATAALVLGANLPDIDVAAVFTQYGLGFRRGITHGMPALIVLPFLLTAVLVAWNRIFPRESRPGYASPLETRPAELLKLAGIAILTHPVLDWMNVYGMRWLMPFNGTWFYGDSLFIVDPWLLLMLGAAWLVGRRTRLTEGGRLRAAGERFGRRMVAASAGYVALMMTVSAAARAVAGRDLGLEHPTRRQLMVAPPFLESWRRDVTADMGEGYRFGRIDWLPRPRLVLQEEFLPKHLELINQLPRTPPLMHLLDWARFPYAERMGNQVHVDDARYARRGRSFAGIVEESRRGSKGVEEGR
jgi:inner membrane protein